MFGSVVLSILLIFWQVQKKLMKSCQRALWDSSIGEIHSYLVVAASMYLIHVLIELR